jgi:tetratricopeptide (TPR) repeat protein
VLVAAILEEFRTRPDRRDDGTFSAPAGTVARVTRAFEAATERPTVRSEALLRLGYYEMSLGHFDAALARFEQVGTPDDVFLRYLQHLFRGRALERVGRTADAIAAYRHALAEAPSAQSAAFPLAVVLAAQRRLGEAADAASRAMAPAGVGAQLDPWTLYFTPDLRFWPDAMKVVRRAIAP